MATYLENEKNVMLDAVLWSCGLLQTNPDIIKEVHTDYINAGCDIITTCSYQWSLKGKNFFFLFFEISFF